MNTQDLTGLQEQLQCYVGGQAEVFNVGEGYRYCGEISSIDIVDGELIILLTWYAVLEADASGRYWADDPRRECTFIVMGLERPRTPDPDTRFRLHYRPCAETLVLALPGDVILDHSLVRAEPPR